MNASRQPHSNRGYLAMSVPRVMVRHPGFDLAGFSFVSIYEVVSLVRVLVHASDEEFGVVNLTAGCP